MLKFEKVATPDTAATLVVPALNEMFDVGTARPAPTPPPAPDLVGEFKRNVDEARARIVAYDDESIRQPFTLRRGDRVLFTIPRIGVVRTIFMNHSIHHRGQLSVYLRMLDVPLPAIYGTSADEAM